MCAFSLSGCGGNNKGFIGFTSEKVTKVTISQMIDSKIVNTKEITTKSVWLSIFEKVDKLKLNDKLMSLGGVYAGCHYAFLIASEDKTIWFAITTSDSYEKTYTARIYKNATNVYFPLGIDSMLKDMVDCYK